MNGCSHCEHARDYKRFRSFNKYWVIFFIYKFLRFQNVGRLQLLDPICFNGEGGANAVTYLGNNTITFCPRLFTYPDRQPEPRIVTMAGLSQASLPIPGRIPADFLAEFESISTTFLHEYTHLVGNGQGRSLSFPKA